MCEAHFTAFIFGPLTAEVWEQPELLTMRYYTLEKSISHNGLDSTVIGGWSDGIHSNHGGGPPALEEAFLMWLESRLGSGSDD